MSSISEWVSFFNVFDSKPFSRAKDDAKQRMKEITSMRMQLDRNLEETNEYRRKLDLSARDHKRLQDDLMTVTRENQVRRKLFCFASFLWTF